MSPHPWLRPSTCAGLLGTARGWGIGLQRQRGSGGRGKARGGSRASARIPRRPRAVPGSRPSGGRAAATALPRARGVGQAQRAASGRGSSRWARPLALNASRRGAAGESGRPAHPHPGPRSRRRSLPAGSPGRRAPRCTCPRRDPCPANPTTPSHPRPGAPARRTIGACLWAEEPRRVRRPRASPLIP